MNSFEHEFFTIISMRPMIPPAQSGQLDLLIVLQFLMYPASLVVTILAFTFLRVFIIWCTGLGDGIVVDHLIIPIFMIFPLDFTGLGMVYVGRGTLPSFPHHDPSKSQTSGPKCRFRSPFWGLPWVKFLALWRYFYQPGGRRRNLGYPFRPMPGRNG